MSNRRYNAVLLFGAPGVGKGTQGRILGKIPGLFYVASGDLFRSLDPNSPAGQEAFQYISAGRLVPDESTVKVWREEMERSVGLGRFLPDSQLLILDGIPRTTPQAEMLAADIEVLRIVNLVFADEEQLVERIRGRAAKERRRDDTDEEIIRHRFQVYREQTKPVLQHYGDDLVTPIDSLRTPVEVLRDVLDALIPVLPAA